MKKNKCPHCSEILTAVRVEQVEGEVALISKSPLVSYACKKCSTVIAVVPDPDALKRELRDMIREQIQRMGATAVM